MTGDIFKFNDTEYGILITPECEVENRKDIQLEFLVFSKDGFEEFLEKNRLKALLAILVFLTLNYRFLHIIIPFIYSIFLAGSMIKTEVKIKMDILNKWIF